MTAAFPTPVPQCPHRLERVPLTLVYRLAARKTMTGREQDEYSAPEGDDPRARHRPRFALFVAGMTALGGSHDRHDGALASTPLGDAAAAAGARRLCPKRSSRSTSASSESGGHIWQVFYEDRRRRRWRRSSGWEHVAMDFGRPAGARRRPTPCSSCRSCSPPPSTSRRRLLLNPIRAELISSAAPTRCSLLRLVVARARAAGKQRAIDLERFQQLKRDSALKPLRKATKSTNGTKNARRRTRLVVRFLRASSFFVFSWLE